MCRDLDRDKPLLHRLIKIESYNHQLNMAPIQTRTNAASDSNAMNNDKSAIPANPFDESVYKLIPPTFVSIPRQARHRSKYAEQSRAEYFSNRKDAASMGPAKVIVRSPKTFLKKGELEARAVKSAYCLSLVILE